MRILFVGGGTLGSVTPLLAVREAVIAISPTTSFAWIGTHDGPEKALIAKVDIPFYSLPTTKLRRYFDLRNITDGFRFVGSFFRARKILKELRPDVVVSAGSFIAVPVVFAARSMGIRVHVHQLDLLPGLANRLSLPSAATVSVSFPELVKRMGGEKRAQFTGTPIREAVFSGDADRARNMFGIAVDRKVVLVLGGGTGALGLNSLIDESLGGLLEMADVVHVTGKGKAGAGERSGYHPVEFLTDPLLDCYAAASLVISRAGIGTLSELAALGLPTIVVPMPESHQLQNAEYFSFKGATVMVEQGSGASEKLLKEARKLLTDGAVREHMSSCGRNLAPHDARERVARVIMNIA